MIAVRNKVETSVPVKPAFKPTKKMVISDIMVGKRPLQGTKLLVKIAINRSRGESMILQPITPQALQPNPIQMVRLCLPQAWQDLKNLSRLNATRGKYPTSSNKVNNGKKIAIGGSMTEITQPKVRNIPSTSKPWSQRGALQAKKSWVS